MQVSALCRSALRRQRGFLESAAVLGAICCQRGQETPAERQRLQAQRLWTDSHPAQGACAARVNLPWCRGEQNPLNLHITRLSSVSEDAKFLHGKLVHGCGELM